MKKFAIFLVLVFSIGLLNCDGDKEKGGENLERFAKYPVSVRKDTDLKDWVATVNKAEKVTLLETVTVPGKEGKNVELGLVRLADDKEGYIETRHLAKLPVFFITEATVYKRPTVGSQVVTKLPRGSIAFVQNEKDNWVQVYAGKINGIWVNEKWVERSSFDTDSAVLHQAIEYEKALKLLDEDKIDEALEKLDSLKDNQSVIGELAGQKYAELTGEEVPGGPAPGGEGLPDDGSADAPGDDASTDDVPADDSSSGDDLP